MSFKIFVHAIRLVFGHLGVALRIGGVLYLVQLAATILAVFTTASWVTNSAAGPDPGALLYLIAAIVVLTVTGAWIAVAWHRYVLLDEMPGAFVARFNGDRTFAYVGRSFLLALIASGLGLVASIIIGVIATPVLTVATQLSSSAMVLVGFFVFLLVYVPLAIVICRLALVLPASAIGQPMRFGEAWAATSKASGAIVGIALLSAVCVWLLDLPSLLLTFGPLLWVRIVWQTLVGWIELMVGVGILTTLYGHYVQRRPIA